MVRVLPTMVRVLAAADLAAEVAVEVAGPDIARVTALPHLNGALTKAHLVMRSASAQSVSIPWLWWPRQTALPPPHLPHLVSPGIAT